MKNVFFLMLSIIIGLVVSCSKDKQEEVSANHFKIEGTSQKEGEDPYLTQLYWSLNNSPMQKKLRNLKPYPVGVVYYQQRGENIDSAIKEFKIIKDLGFTALKQVQIKSPENPSDFKEQVFNAALNVGISPWYYGIGGWAPITQDLVNKLGINLEVNDQNMKAIQNDPKMIDFQTNFIMRPRIKTDDIKEVKLKEFLESRKTEKGEPGRNNPWLPERLVPVFAKWLQEHYANIDSLKKAWNHGFVEDLAFTNWMDAAKMMQGEGFDKFGNGDGKKYQDFRRFRDAMKFQSELIVANYIEMMDFLYKWDTLEPERTGGHQIFENQPSNTWDLEGQAKAASIGGSFYSSIHLAHHLFLVNGEITKPVYMQARIIADMFKGGWAAVWESTGGPTNHSGYYPYTVDEGVMKQLFISYIASGLKGIGLWMWNSRGEGWEMGEYALCDNQGKPSQRAIAAGKISSILQDQRFELWEALDEPVVGVLHSWENEAMLGRLSLGAYPLNTYVFETDWDKQFRQYHSQAKIGISRALMDNNIPFEYVTERDLEAGLAQRYPVIYLPYVIALDDKTLDILLKYVEEGGRLVADMNLLMMDNYGRLNKQKAGSTFEKLFGFQVADYYHTFNSPKSFYGKKYSTYYGDIKVTHATIADQFDGGAPAVMKSTYGKGSTLVFNFEAGRLLFKTDNNVLENIVSWYTLGDIRPQFNVKGDKGSMVFRRAAPNADHYFVINEGEEETISISSESIGYADAQELISGEKLELVNNAFKVKVPKKSAIWIRCQKTK